MPETTSIYHLLFPYGLGAFLAAAVSYAARRMVSNERWLMTWVIGVVAVGFVGFPLSAGDMDGAWVEAVLLVLFCAFLYWSWAKRSALLLAVVWIGHGASDLVHLTTDISPTNLQWVHEMCVSFDWLLGLHVLWRRSAWQRKDQGAPAATDGG